jgi:hypothetical protein
MTWRDPCITTSAGRTWEGKAAKKKTPTRPYNVHVLSEKEKEKANKQCRPRDGPKIQSYTKNVA